MRQEVESFLLIRPQGGAQRGGQRWRRHRAERGRTVPQGRGELFVGRRESVRFAGELQCVQAMSGRLAARQNVICMQSQPIERDRRRHAVRIVRQLKSAPALARKAHPFAAGFQQQRDLFRFQRRVFNAQRDRQIKPVAVRAFRGRSRKLHACPQRWSQQSGEFRGRFDREPGRKRGVPRNEFVGKGFCDVTRPRIGPPVPSEAKVREPLSDRLRLGRIKFQ